MGKAPKIQRLVTPAGLQRKRHLLSIKKARQTKAKTSAAEYQKLLALRQKEMREKKQEKISQRRSQPRRAPRRSRKQGSSCGTMVCIVGRPRIGVLGWFS